MEAFMLQEIIEDLREIDIPNIKRSELGEELAKFQRELSEKEQSI